MLIIHYRNRLLNLSEVLTVVKLKQINQKEIYGSNHHIDTYHCWQRCSHGGLAQIDGSQMVLNKIAKHLKSGDRRNCWSPFTLSVLFWKCGIEDLSLDYLTELPIQLMRRRLVDCGELEQVGHTGEGSSFLPM